MTKQIDLHDAEYTERFKISPLYQKKAIVIARKVTETEHLDTILANGFVETSREVPAGHWIITNPGGEQYAKTEEQFFERYDYLGMRDGVQTFRAKGIIRIITNPTGEPVEIMTPWGAKQYGDARCIFASAVDENYEPTDFCYIIGAEEFEETYEWVEALNFLVQLRWAIAPNEENASEQ